MPSFLTPIDARVAATPERTALICGEQRLAYRQLGGAVARLAARFLELGVAPGDRVAVYLPNSAEAVVSVLAAERIGAVFVVANAGLKTRKLVHVLGDSGARILVTDAAGLERVADRPNSLAHVLKSDEVAALVSAPVPTPAPRRVTAVVDPAAPCYILYTSGSTGGGKGVVMSHRSASFAADTISSYLALAADDVVLTFSPLAADYGLYNVLMALRRGATVVLERGFVFPERIPTLVERESVSGLCLLPTIIALYLQVAAPPRMPGVRFVTTTGQALPAAHSARLQALVPNARIFSMYGLTECKRVSFLDPAELARRPDSVGKPIAGTEAWLVDEAGQRIERPDTIGELVVRGPHLMLGYWNLPAETARCLRPGPAPGEPVLYTGDAFLEDAEGYLYFAGRRDDLIKSSGERISPREIEECIYELPGVTGVIVDGVPDPVLGQAIRATIATNDPSLTADVVRAHCSAGLERALVPRIVDVRAVLPTTLTGKLRRPREAGADGPERGPTGE